MMKLLENVMGKFLSRRGNGIDDAIQQQMEHRELRAERDRESQLLRLSRVEYVDTLMKGVVSEIRGER